MDRDVLPHNIVTQLRKILSTLLARFRLCCVHDNEAGSSYGVYVQILAPSKGTYRLLIILSSSSLGRRTIFGVICLHDALGISKDTHLRQSVPCLYISNHRSRWFLYLGSLDWWPRHVGCELLWSYPIRSILRLIDWLVRSSSFFLAISLEAKPGEYHAHQTA